MDDFDYPRVAAVVVLVVVNLALLGAMSGSSVAFGPYNGDWNGASDFRETLGENAAVHLATSTRTYSEQPASTSLGVVLTPDRPSDGAAMARVRQFVTRGGTLVVAGENASRTNAYLDALGARARLDGRLVRDEQNHYRGPDLPVAANVSDHNLTAGVEQLTLNHGTVVRPHNATVLVNTSQLAYLDANGNGTLDETEPIRSFPVATVERVGSGRVVVVSDASVFTNAMLDQPDNRQFAAALAAGHEDVVLDYSGSTDLPPLVYAVLFVRNTPLVQAMLGLAGLGAIALWTRWDWLVERVSVPAILSDRSDEHAIPRLDATDVTALLRERHPDWDEDRIERVTEAIIRQRRAEEHDD